MIVKNYLLNNSNKLVIYQDSDYFKFSIDSILLANFVTINLSDKKIIDFACGNAVIPMLLSLRTRALIYGVELQSVIYNLGVMSINENKINEQIKLINDDVINLKDMFNSDTFDVITCNPPYFKFSDNSIINSNEIKSIARHDIKLKLDDIFDVSKKILKNNGRIAIVYRVDRLLDVFEKMRKYNLEPKKIRFIYPKFGYDCKLFLLEGVKNGRCGLKVLSPLYIYDNLGNYTEEVNSMFGG